MKARVPSRGVFSCGLILLLGVFSSSLFGQAAPPKESAVKIGSVTLSGSLRIRAEGWDWFDARPADGTYGFTAALLRLSAKQQTTKIDWQVEAAAPLLLGIPSNATAPPPQGQLGLGATYFASNRGQTASVFLKQAFVRFKGIWGDKASSLRLGRFEFSDGAETTPSDPTLAFLKRERIAQRMIGPFGFSHIGRSYDGIVYTRDLPKYNVTAMAARVTEGVFQLEGMDELDVDLSYGAVTVPLHREYSGEARFFVLHYHDGRDALKTDNRPLGVRANDHRNIRITSFGGHYLRAIKTKSGNIDFLFWGAGQAGHWGVLDHKAGAVAAEAGYAPKHRFKPWIRGGWFISSGDGNPSDREHHTFFQILPTPRIYARFPFYNLMNNQDVFAQFMLRPHSRLALRAEAHNLRLSSRNDLWYLGGGAYQNDIFGYAGRPSNGKKALATVLDASADYQVNSHLMFTFYFAGAFGDGVIGSIYPRGKTAKYGYAEMLWRF